MLFMEQSCRELLENSGEDEKTILSYRVGNGVKHHLLHGFSRSLINRGWSRVPSSFSYDGVK